MNKFDGSITYTKNVALRKITYSNYLKITFSNFIAPSLGSVNILFSGRGATGLIVIGASSYSDFRIAKNFASLEGYYIPIVYIKDRLSNNPIYIDVGGGLEANVMIMSQRVEIASIETVDNVPSDYSEY